MTTTDSSRGIASFVVRFAQERWRDAAGEPHVDWRGRIRHVQGDEESSFTDAADAIAFMQRHLTQLTLSAWPGGSTMEGDKLMRESFKLWERLASSYQAMVVESMDKAIEQSDALRQRMDESVARSLQGWGIPGAGDQAGFAAAVTELSEQIAALNARLDRLETKR